MVVTAPDSPSISVALPVYNGADYVASAIDSVLAQAHRDFELVVSDNNSTDGTSEIVAQYAKQDSRVKHHRSDTMLSQADNINRSVDLCSSEWVKFLCHDDLMLPNCLAEVHRVTQLPNADRIGLIGNGEIWLFARGHELARVIDPPGVEIISGHAAIHRFVGQSRAPLVLPGLTNATVRKSVFQAFGGFDPNVKNFDVFLWLTVWTAWDYAFLPAMLTKMRIHAAQVTRVNRMTNRNVEEFRAFFPKFTKQYGQALGLTSSSRLRLALKPLSRSASEIALAFVKGDVSGGFYLLRCAPIHWLPVMPFFMFRALKLERWKMDALRGKVELWEIYP